MSNMQKILDSIDFHWRRIDYARKIQDTEPELAQVMREQSIAGLKEAGEQWRAELDK